MFNIIPSELIGRLLVSFHKLIQNDLVWRYDAVLFDERQNTQAWIQVNISTNSVRVTLRGPQLSTCAHLMETIVEHIRAVGKSYEGVHWLRQYPLHMSHLVDRVKAFTEENWNDGSSVSLCFLCMLLPSSCPSFAIFHSPLHEALCASCFPRNYRTCCSHDQPKRLWSGIKSR